MLIHLMDKICIIVLFLFLIALTKRVNVMLTFYTCNIHIQCHNRKFYTHFRRRILPHLFTREIEIFFIIFRRRVSVSARRSPRHYKIWNRTTITRQFTLRLFALDTAKDPHTHTTIKTRLSIVFTQRDARCICSAPGSALSITCSYHHRDIIIGLKLHARNGKSVTYVRSFFFYCFSALQTSTSETIDRCGRTWQSARATARHRWVCLQRVHTRGCFPVEKCQRMRETVHRRLRRFRETSPNK